MRSRWIIYAACAHYNAREILERRAASVSFNLRAAKIIGERDRETRGRRTLVDFPS